MANTTFFGALGLAETERALVTSVGERTVYEAAAMTLEEHNAQVMASLAPFVEAEVEDWKLTYKYAGGGRLQRLGNRSRAAEIKSGYSWDVGLPLENFGAGFAADRVTMAYATVQDIDRILTTVMNQDKYTVRDEVLKALFNNTTRTFKDELRGDISVRPLANGDTVTYPPLVGSEAAATSQHYIGVASDAQAFTDSNDPFPTIVSLLESHFGIPSGGSPIVIFVNAAQATRAKLLATFDPVINRYVTAGVNTDRVDLGDLPPIPGRVIGAADGAIIAEWPFIPAGYIVGIHLEAPKPLLKRKDMQVTGLPTGLSLVSRDTDHPFERYEWVHRFGFGCGNRLNGVVMDLDTGSSTYTIPSAWQ